MEIPEATLKGIRLAGAMTAEIVKAMVENGLTREEALNVGRDWLLTFVSAATAKGKAPTDALVEYMKTLNPREPGKQ